MFFGKSIEIRRIVQVLRNLILLFIRWLSVSPPTVDQESRPKSTRLYCNSFPLTQKQKNICYRHPHLLSKISEGFKDGVSECQYQMKHRRWNCTTHNSKDPKKHVLEPIIKIRKFLYISKKYEP